VNGSDPNKKGFSHELRLLLAFALSFLVMSLWIKYFGPKPSVEKPGTAATATATPGSPETPANASPAATAPAVTRKPVEKTAAVAVQAAPASVPVIADTQERTFVIESDLYRVEFSNRGAVVKSWQLKKYTDDAKPQRILDLVHPEAAEQTGGWPFSLSLDDASDEASANKALYKIEPGPAGEHGVSQVRFSWSDGHLQVTKEFRFDESYTAHIRTTVTHDGKPVVAGLAWRGGFGDLTVADPAPVEQVSILFNTAGKLKNLPHKDLKSPGETPRTFWYTGMDYAGIEDRYFVAAFLPDTDSGAKVATRYWKLMRDVKTPEKTVQEPVAEMAAGNGTTDPVSLRVYIGPKDYEQLKKMNPPLHALVQFGWMEFIAEPLFHALKWTQRYIPNWGWAIIALTLVINMVLFPMRISSYRTMLKMRRVAPEVSAIKERYKKYKLNDPKKAEENKEVMALYQREGINPLGGCFQMLVQMPIWFGLNTALRYSIELRHARWLWVSDLSAKDPHYILPVTVGISMYLVSKMTPMATTDPSQETMMKFMPIMMAASFIFFPFSSGLALYILTSSVVGIGQQWYLNKTHPEPAKPARGKK